MDGSKKGPILTVEHVTKAFGGVQAMRDGSFDLKRGEVVAIVGGNGAGKSTLAKIVSGAHVPDSGSIYIKGVEVARADHSVSHMQDCGIEVVYQDLALVPNMTAPYNLFLGRIPRKWRIFVDEKKCARKRARCLSNSTSQPFRTCLSRFRRCRADNNKVLPSAARLHGAVLSDKLEHP